MSTFQLPSGQGKLTSKMTVRLLAILTPNRRSFRRILFAIAFLAMVIVSLKLKNSILDLNEEQNFPSDTGVRLALTKAATESSREASMARQQKKAQVYVDDDFAGEGKAFAQLGINLVKIPSGKHKNDNSSWEHFLVRLGKDSSISDVQERPGSIPSELLEVPKNAQVILKSKGAKSESINISNKSKEFYYKEGYNINMQVSNDRAMPGIAPGDSNSPTAGISSDDLVSQQQNLHPRPWLAILIVSRPNNILYRQATRQTWARSARDLGATVRFIVGRDQQWDDIVNREKGMHADLIIVEEEDVYDLLPTKVLEGLTWVLHQENGFDYVMKTDDDTIVNLPYLLEELYAGVINSTQILGAICRNASVVRDPSDKWSVSVLDYPFNTYPVYAAGGGYVMSTRAASALLQARSRTLGWIHLEDVYITGILAAKAKLSHVAHPGFSYGSDAQAKPCDFVQHRRLISLGHTDREMTAMYAGINAMLNAEGDQGCDVRTSDPKEKL